MHRGDLLPVSLGWEFPGKRQQVELVTERHPGAVAGVPEFFGPFTLQLHNDVTIS